MFDFFKKKASFGQLGFVSDCHCHVLPAVDDGVKSQDEAVQVLREMISMGVKSVVLTPHINPDVYPESGEQLVRSRFQSFLEAIPGDVSSAVNITLGAEYMVTQGFENRDPSELLQFLPGKVLVEMSYFYPSNNMEQTIFNLMMAGLHPVIAHPERYLYYAHSKHIFEKYHDMGAAYQMNAVSLSGAYGEESLSILKFLLDKGWYEHIGTDTHNTFTLDRIRQMQFDSSLLDRSADICSGQLR